MRPTLALTLVVCFLPLLGAADPPQPTPEQLVEQLASTDFKVRAAASKALEQRGLDVLPVLRKALGHTDPEVRRRVEELIPALELTATLSPKRVTLKLENRPVKEAIQELAKQTGYKINYPEGQFNPRGEKLVYSFQLKEATFWEALDKICEVSGLTMQHGYGDDQFRLYYQDAISPFVHRSGPFRLVAEGFHYSRSISFSAQARNAPGNGQSSEYLNFNFHITVEPKLPLLGLGEVKLTAALDDQGNSMVLHRGDGGNAEAVVGRRFYRYGGGYRQYQQHASVNLLWPVKTARTVKELKGVVPITLLTEQRPEIVVEKILTAKGKKFKAGTTELDIEDVKAVGGQGAGNKMYDLKMAIRDSSRDNVSGDYNWTYSLNQRLELQDAKGNKYISRGNNWNSQSPSSVQGTFMFGESGNQQLGPAEKLVLYNWITMEHEVVFEFKNLPLP